MSPFHSLLKQVETTGEAPPAGFAHTFVQVTENKAILFGGTLDISQGVSQFTNKSYEYDIDKQVWAKLNVSGLIPSARAAHAADKIGNNLMIMFGGTGSSEAGLCKDDLFLLDTSKAEAIWVILSFKGPKPGPRYGHSLVFNNPYVIIFGGHTGDEALSDTWVLNLDKKHLSWEKVPSPDGVSFSPRVYHSAALCLNGVSSGMMVIFGGRNSQSEIVESTWGLRRHRDYNWDWVPAPCKRKSAAPTPSYQNTSHFFENFLVIIGGRNPTEKGSYVDSLIYDTKSSEWCKGIPVDRNRHVSFFDTRNQKIYIYGGFERGKKRPCDKLSVIESLSKIFPEFDFSFNQNKPRIPRIMISNTEGGEESRVPTFPSKVGSINVQLSPQNEKNKNERLLPSPANKIHLESPNSAHIPTSPKTIRIANQAMVAVNYGPKASPEGYIKEIPLNDLAKEKKRMGSAANRHMNVLATANLNGDIADYFIELLLKWNGDYDENHVVNRPSSMREWFNAESENLFNLFHNVKEILIKEKGLLRLASPIKIFGSLDGNLRQLRNIFENFGYPDNNPLDNGDIEKFDYLFLGNIVDRELSSPDMLILLLALKLKYPDHIYLLLGEAELKLAYYKVFNFDRRDLTSFDRFSESLREVFSYFPLAATVDNRIFCSHSVPRSGIKLLDLEILERPLNPGNIAFLGDLILSQYVEREDTIGDKKFRLYGKSKIKDFLIENKLEIVIRGKEGTLKKGCCQEMSGSLLTLVSGFKMGSALPNIGFIKIKKNFEISMEIINFNGDLSSVPNMKCTPMENGGGKSYLVDPMELYQSPSSFNKMQNNK